ncbi:unnamed protein product [Dicrocoelium dendriticum]|nr:unnamed protein product [Dicrocoelium dendriticum]
MAIVGGGASCSTGSGDDAASEADSGVVVYSSEANGTANAPNNSSPSCTHTPPTREQCPVCAAVLHQIPDYVNVNRRAQDFWPKNVALENLLSRISDPLKNDKEAEQEPVEFAPAEHCQLCEITNHGGVTYLASSNCLIHMRLVEEDALKLDTPPSIAPHNVENGNDCLFTGAAGAK